MSFDSGTILSGFMMLIGGVVWLVRLEGRVNVTSAQFEEILRRLDRIEHRQDHDA